LKELLLDIPSFDGYKLKAKLDMNDIKTCEKLIVFIHGTGPNTYDNRRKIGEVEFNYFDLYVNELCKMDYAFCRWNTRGCFNSEKPPMYVDINEEEYKTYLPSSSIKDIEHVIRFLKNMDCFKNSKIYLFGASEGATLAPLVAFNKNVHIDGLILMGYSNENMKTTLEWQMTGGSSMVNMCKMFDYEHKGFITKENFEEDRHNLRPIYFKNIKFKKFDKNRDGILTKEDFEIMLRKEKEALFHAITTDNDKWIKKNYSVRITSKWCKEHFMLPPMKEVLPSIDVPIHIFHGRDDANIPVEDIFNIDRKFKMLGKENLTIHVFDGHDHDLNYMLYPFRGVISEGIQSIFDTIKIM